MSNSPDNKGKFVISLDFELMWGMFDKVSNESYSSNLDGVSEIIPKLLTLFSKYEIQATWATVGMLMCADETEWTRFCPDSAQQTPYENSNLSAYKHAKETNLKKWSAHYFAPELVEAITNTPNQELASHTFSHYYCREALIGEQGNETSFSADCTAINAVAEKFSVKLSSLVFPRNQWTTEVLRIAIKHGINCYRGTESHLLYSARDDKSQNNLFIRAFRLLDNYINLSGHHTYSIMDVNESGAAILNIPASRFLRPYSKKLFWAEPLRLRRIKKAMTYAAKQGEVFHLWWHPHNFGVNQKQNLAFLTKILTHYKKLEHKYGMKSINMKELAKAEFESSVSER